MSIKVCKFGGTSMADGHIMRRVAQIIFADEARRYIVVSAPGKRFGADLKVTDLLYACYREIKKTGNCNESFFKIRIRFTGIVHELKLDMDIDALLDKTQADMERVRTIDFCASRGEYLNANIMAAFLHFDMVDASEFIRFDEEGMLNEKETYALAEKVLIGHTHAVIPGFYGLGADGKIKTFSRGGSDITGAIVARGARACLYENWTDVSGFFACDPRIIPQAKHIKVLSYKELRELSYSGANVLHSDCIIPVREMSIPINIRNTFRPEDEGTMILPSKRYEGAQHIVTGIAGKKNFTVIYVEHSLMNTQIGFAEKVLSVLREAEVSFEHMPTGIDTLSIVIESERLKDGKLEKILAGIHRKVNPDILRIVEDIALVVTVGHGMHRNVGTAGRLFQALSENHINVRMIDQGSSELNIIIGVDNKDCEKTIAAIYSEFFEKES